MFYIAQIAAGIYRSSGQCEGDFPPADDFDTFYAQHYSLLHQDAWRECYSPAFLAQPSSARFYRLPDLRDLQDASDPLCQPRQKGGMGHLTKLPFWANNVVRTHRRQPDLPVATLTELGRSTLRHTISRLRVDHPDRVQPYSETQASFWLKHSGLDSPADDRCPSNSRGSWKPNQAGLEVAQGAIDMWAWEAHYSRKRWEEDSLTDDASFRQPDLDGTRPSEARWCGWPDGAGVSISAWWRGWEPEMGNEQDIAFLAAVAAKETESLQDGDDMDKLDYAVRSHILLTVMRTAELQTDKKTREHVEELKRRMVEAGRIDEGDAQPWVQQALMVTRPYVHKWRQRDYASIADRSELLRHILIENGQLFARWKLPPTSKEFDFTLKPRT